MKPRPAATAENWGKCKGYSLEKKAESAGACMSQSFRVKQRPAATAENWGKCKGYSLEKKAESGGACKSQSFRVNPRQAATAENWGKCKGLHVVVVPREAEAGGDRLERAQKGSRH